MFPFPFGMPGVPPGGFSPFGLGSEGDEFDKELLLQRQAEARRDYETMSREIQSGAHYMLTSRAGASLPGDGGLAGITTSPQHHLFLAGCETHPAAFAPSPLQNMGVLAPPLPSLRACA